jgi:vesicle coat complex subunit
VEDSNSLVRGSAAVALGNIGLETAIPSLLQLVEHPDIDVRWSAAKALGKIGSETAIDALLKLVEDADSLVRRSAVQALGKIGSETAIDALLKLVEHPDIDVRGRAAEALGKIAKKDTGAPQYLPHLLSLIPTRSGEAALSVILAIQENCKFYNYEIWWEAIQNEKLEIKNGEQEAGVGQTTNIFNIETLNAPNAALNLGGTIHGDQSGTQNH